jgi:branched-chain amino acid transport system permease protein
MKHPSRVAPGTPPSFVRRFWPLAALSAAVTAIVAVTSLGSDQLQVTITEMLIRMVVVVGIYLFVGNSGILSFGHIGFMCIGAYAAAWATVDPTWKQMMLTGLPDFLQQNQYGFLPARRSCGSPVSPARSPPSPSSRSSTASIRTGNR